MHVLALHISVKYWFINSPLESGCIIQSNFFNMILVCSGCFGCPRQRSEHWKLKKSMKCVMRWHQILWWVCVASGCDTSICQGPPVANLPLHSLKWAHSPPIWIIHHSAHTELYLVAGKCPVLQDKQDGLLKWEQLWLSRSTSLLPFDNSHLVLLLCAAQLTKWKNGLRKIIINASGLQTGKEHFFSLSSGKATSFQFPYNSCFLSFYSQLFYFLLAFLVVLLLPFYVLCWVPQIWFLHISIGNWTQALWDLFPSWQFSTPAAAR